MNNIVTSREAIKAAFQEYYSNAVANPEKFNPNIAEWEEDDYPELVTEYFLQLLEKGRVNANNSN